MKNKALLSGVLRWMTFPMRSKVTVVEWSGFLALAIIVSFLWATVVNEID